MRNRANTVLVLAIATWAASFQPPEVFASGGEFEMRGSDLVVTVDSRWAGTAQGGYYPIRIHVRNAGPSRNLTFRLQNTGKGMPTVQITKGVKQQGEARFTLSVPMVGEGSNGILRVYSGGREIEGLTRGVGLPAMDFGSFDRPSLLVIAEGVVDCTAFEGAINSMTGGVTGGYTGYGGSTRTTDNQVVPPTALPDSWIDYSGLDIVAIGLDKLAGLSRQHRSAILHWVHQGGSLIVFNVGEPVEQSRELTRVLKLNQHNAVSAAWQPAAAGQPGFPNIPYSRRQLMLGEVFAFPGSPFPGTQPAWSSFLRSSFRGQQPGIMGVSRGPINGRFQWTSRNGICARRKSSEFLQFLIPGIKGVPVSAFIVLITMFSIVIGPLNYFLLWRRKQLYLLVLSIPVIAVVTSFSLFGYSVIAHGFSIKSRVRSLTVLDQKAKTAVSMSRISLYAGLAPSRGLQFSPETAVYTIWPSDEAFESGRVDWTESQRLQSGWLRSRTRTQFLTTSHRAERGRMEVEPPQSGKVKISNGLEWDIKLLVLADENGTLYTGKQIPAGVSTLLVKAEANEGSLKEIVDLLETETPKFPDGASTEGRFSLFGLGPSRRYRYRRIENAVRTKRAASLMEQRIEQMKQLETHSGGLEKKSYLAILEQNPGIELGVDETDEQASLHLLVGYY